MGFIAPALPYIIAAASVASAGASIATRPKPPGLPRDPNPLSLQKSMLDASNAVQTKESEERRQRLAQKRATVLTSGLGVTGGAAGSSPSLQAADARKTVLG